MKQIPEDAAAYKRTPVFTEQSIPAGLLNEHKTKEGVWGKIVILDGKLLYTITHAAEEHILDNNHSGVVEPTVIHRVKPLGKVAFYVEFYR